MRCNLLPVLAKAVGILCVVAVPLANAADLVPYQSTGWKYMQVSHGDALNGTFMGTLFDDSGWSTGQAAFGSGGGCPLSSTKHTSWSSGTNMLLRRSFFARADQPVTIHVGIDNDVSVWVNGTLVGSNSHEFCATLDNFNYVVPASALATGGGANVLAVKAVDRGGESFVDVRVEGTANTPPDCSAAVASEQVLWPPNHTYHAVSVEGVTDADGDPVTVTVTGVTQDEPVNGRGDGNTCPDAQIVDGQASLRAERSGTAGNPGNGRVYAISYTADDGQGGTCTGTVNVCVPHDQDPPICVDDGQRFDSTGPCTGGNELAPESVSLAIAHVTASEAEINFALPADTHVNVSVYDLVGRRVATIENGSLSSGNYSRVWNMGGIARGMYFVRMHTGSTTLTQKVLKTR